MGSAPTTPTASQKVRHEPCAGAAMPLRKTTTNRYAVAASTSHTMYRRKSRMKPSGRSARMVATTPAPMTKTDRGTEGTRFAEPSAMTRISTAAQPTHWAMLSAVGIQEPRRPSSPRKSTIEGAPVSAPGTAASASTAVPRTVPTRTAVMAAARVSGGRSAEGRRTKAAATGMVSVMPRLPQREAWSLNPRGRGGASSRVSGASCVSWVTDFAVESIHPPFAGITRTGSCGRRLGAALSARSHPSSRVWYLPFHTTAGAKGKGLLERDLLLPPPPRHPDWGAIGARHGVPLEAIVLAYLGTEWRCRFSRC